MSVRITKMSLGLMLAVSKLAVLCMCSYEREKENAAVNVWRNSEHMWVKIYLYIHVCV